MYIKKYELFFESKSDIDSICYKYGIENYTINDDGTIDVDGNVDLSHEKLTKLPLKFGRVTGSFYCGHNKLTTLEGSPYWISGYFDCSINQLKSLEGGPKNVLGEYLCNNNQLVNFRGFPEDYETTVWDNENWHFIGMSGIYMKDNPVNKLLFNLPEYKWNKFIYWCNEYDAIDDQGKVIPERMEEVYNKLGLEYEDYTPNTW